jgi:CHASE2 domain-containing sensor protein
LRRTRLSLLYLCGYLLLIGFALLLFPTETLRLLLSNGDYGDIMPRVAGMFMAGVGLNVAGIIASRAEASYLSTLLVRTFFLVCIAAFYAISRDPFFPTLGGIVVLGMLLTGASYLRDRSQPSPAPVR